MAATTNLGLYITDDSSESFQTFRRKVAGTGSDSNMVILDSAIAAAAPVVFSVTLSSSNWNSHTNTVSNAGFLTGNYSYIITPAPSSVPAWSTSGIYAGDIVTAGQCVFTSQYNNPSTNVTAYVLRIKEGT